MPTSSNHTEVSVHCCQSKHTVASSRTLFSDLIILVVKLERGRVKDSIKMNIRETGWCGTDWINLAQDRDQWRALVNKVMNFRVSESFGKFLNSRAIDGF
jgi:hypothetical protein